MERSLAETVLIVTLVVFAFLGSPRSVIIPVVTIPLSLIGTFAVMLVLGFSINLLSLLALVLAIGLVVDDAIIVVESVNRHLEEGMRPRDAAMQAARELANPIIAMTVGADRGLCADRLPGRPDRRAVHRVRLHRGRRGDDVGDRCTDAVADDVRVPAEARIHREPARGWADRLTGLIDRALQPPAALATNAGCAAACARLPVTLLFAALVDRQHLLPVRQRQQRTRAAGGSGRRHSAADLRSRCDIATKATVWRSGARHHGESAGGGSELQV